MMPRILAFAALATLSTSTAFAQASYTPRNDEPNPYQPGASWGQLPDGRKWGSTAGIDVAPDGTIWAYDRCGANNCAESNVDPILHFDTSGKLINAFGRGMFNFPHGLHVDASGNVWATDHGRTPANGRGHVVYKFSPEGKLLMTLGTMGVAGNSPTTFNNPSDVLVAPNGDIFVADGHGPTTNARIAANEFASDAGVRVGGIRDAQQGGFVIRDVGSEYGDTRSIEKDVRLVTTITFYLAD